MTKYLDLDGLSYLWDKITTKFVAKETGKGLSTNDFTTTEKTKLAGIEAGAEANDIESVSVNGTALTPVNKGVNIPIGQYMINGTGYDILGIEQATVQNVEGFYIHYDDGSINGAFVFVPNMVGVTYASGQIIATAQGNASTLISAREPSATPLMDGTASIGSGIKFAYEDHVHPTDTSRQATLVSGTNIKTINGTSILGSGDLTINASSIAYDDSQTQLGNDVQSALETLDEYNSSISQAVTNIRQLPSVTASDNGKVLRVVNGAWAVVSLPSASGVNF